MAFMRALYLTSQVESVLVNFQLIILLYKLSKDMSY